MTTATITCHDVYNFGASLQAYALQQWQLKHGIQNIIIDYKPPYLSGHFSFKKVNPRYDRPVLRWLYRAAKFRGRYMALAKKRKFDEFTRNCLVLSSRRYDGIDSLRLNPPEADCYIAGSDGSGTHFSLTGRTRLSISISAAMKLAAFRMPRVSLRTAFTVCPNLRRR